MRRTRRLACAALTVFLLTTGCTSGREPSGGDAGSAGVTDSGAGDGFELPADASPRLRRAFERAVEAETERDQAQADALAIVEQYPVPSVAPEPPTPGPTLPAGGVTDPPGQSGSDPSATGDTAAPTANADVAAEPVQVAPPQPTVPPDVRQGLNEWVEAQRNLIRKCLAVEAEHKTSEGFGQRVDPVCRAERTPSRFLPWLQLMGYTETALRTLVLTGL